MKKIISFKFSFSFLVCLACFLTIYKVQSILTMQRLETLVDTVNVQRKWHGLSLDNYSLGIVLNSFINKQKFLNPKSISVEDSAHTRYLKQFNSTSSFFSNLAPINLQLIVDDKKVSLESTVQPFILVLWISLSACFSFLILRLYKSLRARVANKQRVKIAKQVAHDIQAPISALSSVLLSNESQLTDDQVELIKGTIGRIQEIAGDLSNSKKTKEPKKLDLVFIIKQIEREFQARGLRLDVRFKGHDLPLNIELDNEFSRHITNLVNNAFEASKHSDTVRLEICVDNNNLKITIIDQGIGIPKNILKMIESGVSITHGKSDGQGIGMYYAKKYIESKNGSIEVRTEINNGTTVLINLPQDITSEIIQVEDDPFVRKAWEIESRAKNIPFRTFASFHDLKSQLHTISKTSTFYLDINLGDDIDGLQIARELDSIGYKNIHLATGEESKDLLSLPYISGISDKSSPFSSLIN